MTPTARSHWVMSFQHFIASGSLVAIAGCATSRPAEVVLPPIAEPVMRTWTAAPVLANRRALGDAGTPDSALSSEEVLAAALAFNPHMKLARAGRDLGAAGVLVARERANPTLSLSPEHLLEAAAGVSPWVLAVSIVWPMRTAGKRDLAIEGTRRTRSQRSRRASDAIDDASAIDGNGRRECATKLEEHEGHSFQTALESCRLLLQGEHHRAQFVRGAHVHTVHLAMVGHRRQMNDTRREYHRHVQASKQAHHGTKTANASHHSLWREAGQPQVIVCDIPGWNQRQSVPGGSGNEIQRCRLFDEACECLRIPERLGGRQRAIEKDLAGVEPTDIEGNRARIDAENARHRRQCRAGALGPASD